MTANDTPTKSALAKAVTQEIPRTRRIILEENDGIPPVGQFISLNGKAYLLKPGVEADVPEGVTEVLDNAVYSKPIRDPQTQQITGYTDALRFPYRIVRRKEAA